MCLYYVRFFFLLDKNGIRLGIRALVLGEGGGCNGYGMPAGVSSTIKAVPWEHACFQAVIYEIKYSVLWTALSLKSLMGLIVGIVKESVWWRTCIGLVPLFSSPCVLQYFGTIYSLGECIGNPKLPSALFALLTRLHRLQNQTLSIRKC